MRIKFLTLLLSAFLLLLTSSAWAQQGTPATVQIQIDKTAPPAPTVTVNHPVWTNQDVTVTVSGVQDNAGGAGVDHLGYSTDGGSTWQTLPGNGSINITNEGTYNIQAKTYDKVGHVGPLGTATAQIDKTLPTINVTGVTDAQTYYAAVTPDYTISDSGGSGLATQSAVMTKDGSGIAWSKGNTVSAGGAYILTVTASDSAGNSQTSITHFTIAAPVAPGAPTLTASSNSSLHVTWNSVSGATGYKVYRDGDGTPVYDGASTSFDDGGLSTNTQHSYTVEAYNAVGPSPQSSSSSAWTLASQPINLHVTSATSTSITVAWSVADNPAGTQFYAEITGSGHNDSVAYTPDLVIATFNGLSSGTSYTVNVKTKNGAGVETLPVSLAVTSNTPPSVTITLPTANEPFSEVSGYKMITVSGTVTDVDDDTCTVTTTISGVSHNQVVSNCAGGKPFSITFDVTADNIPEGTQTVSVVADDGK